MKPGLFGRAAPLLRGHAIAFGKCQQNSEGPVHRSGLDNMCESPNTRHLSTIGVKDNEPGTKDKYVPGLLHRLQAALLCDMIPLDSGSRKT